MRGSGVIKTKISKRVNFADKSSEPRRLQSGLVRFVIDDRYEIFQHEFGGLLNPRASGIRSFADEVPKSHETVSGSGQIDVPTKHHCELLGERFTDTSEDAFGRCGGVFEVLGCSVVRGPHVKSVSMSQTNDSTGFPGSKNYIRVYFGIENGFKRGL